MLKCRACLKLDDDKMIAFDEHSIINYNLLTNLNTVLHDHLPQQMCQDCFKMLDVFIEFRAKCIKSNSYLQEISEEEKLSVADIKPAKIDLDTHILDVVKTEFEYEYLIENDPESYDDNEMDYEENDVSNSSKRKTDIQVKEELKELKLDCGLCEEWFESTDLLSQHLKSHKTCKLCEAQFSDWPSLCIHRFNHLSMNNKHCHICFNQYKNARTLLTHYLQKHFRHEKVSISCTECNKRFKSMRSLKKHKWGVHSKKEFKCDYCKKIYNRKSALAYHISKNHLEAKTISCDLCNYTSRFLSNLKEHRIRRHAPERVYCKPCGRPFVNQEALKSHICNRQKSATICPICGKVFDKKTSIDRHLQSHNEDRKYKCDQCPATYKYKSALREHRNKHDGIRKKCEFCDASFFSSSVLIKHRRIHTGEKPYVCKVCQKGFTGNNNLKVHMRVHGEYLVNKKGQKEEAALFNPLLKTK